MTEPEDLPQRQEQAAAAEASEPAQKPMSTFGKVWRGFLGLTVGLGFMALFAWWKNIDLKEVAHKASAVPVWAIAFCVVSAFIVLAFQALRWHLVMSPLLGLSYGDAYRAQVIGQMFNAILPARGGDLLRVQYLGRRSGKSRATILGTEVVDRWLDWWGWMPIIAVLSITSDMPAWIYKAVGAFGCLLVLWGGTMVILTRRGWKPKPGSKIGAIYDSFRTGVQLFRGRRTLGIALAVAPLCWAWEVIALVVASRAFGIELTFGMAFSVLIGFNLAMVVPSAGGVGVVETGGTAALVFFHVDETKALAFMFVYHFTQLLPAIAAGAGILAFEGEALFGKTGKAPAPVTATAKPALDEAKAEERAPPAAP